MRPAFPFGRAILLLLVAAAAPVARAQVPIEAESWRWTSFGREDGLPAGGISSLAEAADGIVWAATDAGLAWFDGFVWHAMGTPQGVSERPGGRLVPAWGSRVFALIHNQLYLGDTAGFTRSPIIADRRLLDSTRENRAVEQVVDAVAPIATDDMLVLVRVGNDPDYRKGLLRVRGGTVMAAPVPEPLGADAGLFGTRTGGVYLSTPGRLYRWAGDDWEAPRHIDDGRTSLAMLAGNEGGDLVAYAVQPVDRRGVLEGTERGSMVRAETEGNGWARAGDIGPRGDAIMVYTSGHVRLRHDGRWAALAYAPPALGRSARSALFSSDGNLWFGTEEGVVLYRASAHRWTTRSFPFPDRRAIVNAIVRARSGDVWTGTEDGIVVYRLDRTEPEWIRAVGGRPLGAITGLAEDGTGAIWVASGLSFPGAYRWDGRSWRHFGEADGLSAPRVHDIAVDREGRPWFLGIGPPGDVVSGPGAFRFVNGRFERWGEAEGLPSGRVYGFADDSTGARWFATLAGVSRWRDGRWTHWQMWSSTLPGGRTVKAPVRPQALAAGSGRVWIADRTLGVGAIDANDSLRFWGQRDGLLSGVVFDVHEDDGGTVWASTARGLCSFRDDAGQWQCLGPAVGLATDAIWPLVVTRQEIFVGTQGEGLQVLSRAEASDPPPRVEFAEPIVRGRTVEVRWHAHAFEGALPSPMVATRHRIDRGPWSRWSTQRSLTLTGELPGRHVVEVQARGLFDVPDAPGATFVAAVPLPFMLRPAFAIPVGTLLVVLAVVTISSWRQRERTLADLRSSEARFRSLGEAAFEGIGFAGDGDILEVNQRLAEMLGYRREELIGCGLDRLVASRSLARLPQIQQMMRRKHPDEPAARLEVWARRKDGSEFPVEVQTKAMPLGPRLVRVLAVRDITGQHESETARQRSEEKFEKAFWASPDAIDIAQESSGRFIEVNEALVRLHGRPRDQMIGRSGAELGLWADESEREAYWERVRREGRVRGFEARLRNATGETRHCVISAERMEIGGEACIIALTRDVTVQRRTVEALRMTQFSVDHAGDAILWVDPVGKVAYVNEAAAAATERRPEELVGSEVASLNEAWTVGAWREFWRLVKDQGATLRVGTWRTGTGFSFPVELLCNHLATEGREYMVVSGRDISERVAAEQALLASEAKFATAFRSSPNGMVIVRASDGVVLEVNGELLRLLEARRSAVIGRTAAALNLWADAGAWEHFRDAVIAGRCDAPVDVRVRHGPEERVVLLSAEPLELREERCLLCVLQDVTEQDRARRALEESRRALRVLSRQLMEAQEAERARISRELHDEIGQTLAAVKLNLQAIGRLTADARITAQVRDGIAVVDATVVEVRNLSRELRPSVLDDLGLAAALKWYLGRQAERASLTVEFTPQPDLPRALPEIETACYRIVQEAMTNVLRHAGATRVDVRVGMEDGALLLTIRDDGCGFDPTILDNAVDAETHLGVVGMRERAENIGGTLVLESRPGEGTIVRARFANARFDASDASADATGAPVR